MNGTENNNRAASHDFQTALRLLEERLRSLEDSEDIINGLPNSANPNSFFFVKHCVGFVFIVEDVG